ncbi:MAG: hypothetical protein ACFFD6_01840 [Candidatus Thorarchaeota archaeon]
MSVSRHTLAALMVLLLFSATLMNSGEATSDTSSTAASFSTLEPGSFLEYTLSTQLLVLWNYTLNDGAIVTRDEISSREVLLTPALTHEITITLDVIEEKMSGVLTLQAKYESPSILGHFFNGVFELSYAPETGTCTILNGSLAGQTGIMNLVSRAAWSSEEVIISSLDRNITGRQTAPGEGDFICTVKGEQQLCQVYGCEYYDSVDGNVGHSRYYDADSRLLVHASRDITDRILLGLVNISYADYRLELTGTNIDLGPAYSVGTALAIQGILMLSGAAAIIIGCVIWRKKRLSRARTDVFTADTLEPKPPRSRTFSLRAISGVRASRKFVAAVVVILLIVVSGMMLGLPFPREHPQEEHVLFVTPANDVDHMLGEWRAGDFYLPPAPQGQENLITIHAEILDWGVCPAPLQLGYRISEMSLEDFLSMNTTERDGLPTNGMFINEGASSSGRSNDVKSGSRTYTWYYRFTAPYANETSCTLRASVTISLIIRDIE